MTTESSTPTLLRLLARTRTYPNGPVARSPSGGGEVPVTIGPFAGDPGALGLSEAQSRRSAMAIRTRRGALGSFEREMQDLLSRIAPWRWSEGATLAPATDIYREDGTLVVRTELPGVDPEAIDVEVVGTTLRIRGEKRHEREVADADRYVYECRYGKFERDVPLPEGVDASAVVARFDHGVLTVRIAVPEAAETGRKKIEVEVTGTT
jgi:HSP20 family protein